MFWISNPLCKFKLHPPQTCVLHAARRLLHRSGWLGAARCLVHSSSSLIFWFDGGQCRNQEKERKKRGVACNKEIDQRCFPGCRGYLHSGPFIETVFHLKNVEVYQDIKSITVSLLVCMPGGASSQPQVSRGSKFILVLDGSSWETDLSPSISRPTAWFRWHVQFHDRSENTRRLSDVMWSAAKWALWCAGSLKSLGIRIFKAQEEEMQCPCLLLRQLCHEDSLYSWIYWKNPQCESVLYLYEHPHICIKNINYKSNCLCHTSP